MKVAILTMFNNLSSTYSLVNIVAEQLRMLLDANIETKVLVSEHLDNDERRGVFLDDRIEWVKIVNFNNKKLIRWWDYSSPTGKVHDTFFEEVDVIADDFVDKLSNVDVCIMHDIHYQGIHLIHNVAIRKAQKKLMNVRFIAFTHSIPKVRPQKVEYPFSARFSSMPNTVYVYPTQSGIPALAKQYNVPEERCRVVSNSLNLRDFLSEEVLAVQERFNIFPSDIFVVYPGRLTTSKKLENVAAFCGAIKKVSNYNVKVLFCDFEFDVQPEKYKTMISLVGCNSGLDAEDIAFTSDLGFEQGFPRKGVLELFSLSNLFICPSYSESFGLTVLEAASKGNFLILNEGVPALEELGKNLNAYFMRWGARNFGFDTKETYTPSEQAYYEFHAAKVVRLIMENPVLHAKTISRQRFSPEWVWSNQLEPLLKGFMEGEKDSNMLE